MEEEAAQESALAALLRSLEVGSTARVLDARIVEEWQVLQVRTAGLCNAMWWLPACHAHETPMAARTESGQRR